MISTHIQIALIVRSLYSHTLKHNALLSVATSTQPLSIQIVHNLKYYTLLSITTPTQSLSIQKVHILKNSASISAVISTLSLSVLLQPTRTICQFHRYTFSNTTLYDSYNQHLCLSIPLVHTLYTMLHFQLNPTHSLCSLHCYTFTNLHVYICYYILFTLSIH